jgi:hypothetical protein
MRLYRDQFEEQADLVAGSFFRQMPLFAGLLVKYALESRNRIIDEKGIIPKWGEPMLMYRRRT